MKRILALVTVIGLILSLCPVSFAASEKQHDYAAGANSGIRHEVCTSLLGTSADTYYTGSYTYDNLSQLNGDDLLLALRKLMTDTHTYKSTYANCRDWADLTDCENADGTTIILLYSSFASSDAQYCNNLSNGWNREHVWPQSLGGFSTSGAGSDLHHVRPCDQIINSTRNNLKYGNVSGGSTATGAGYTGRVLGGYYKGNYFEPLDNVKGDVARICLYMYARYGGDSRYTCGDLTVVFESIDVLLEWCALDPVDTWEIGRNEVVGYLQGNRNVFIDYPEFAWLIFDRDIPTGMTTPSGEAGDYVPSACTHSSTTVKNDVLPTCTASGYTGDTYCSDCGEKLYTGHAIDPTGHTNNDGNNTCDICGKAIACGHGNTELRYFAQVTCSQAGYTGDTYCLDCGMRIATGTSVAATGHIPGEPQGTIEATCGTPGYTGDVFCSSCNEPLQQGEMLDPTGAHSFSDWSVIQEATQQAPGQEQRSCTVCQHTESREIPALTVEDTTPTETAPVETQPTEPSAQPTEPSAQPTEPSAQPTDTTPSETEPQPTAQPTTQPQQEQAPTATDPVEPEQDSPPYLLSVIFVLAAVAVCIVIIFTRKKRKDD